MKGFLLFCFLIAALWDGATTVLGTAVILQAQEPLQYGFCVAAAFVVLGLGFGTRTFLSKSGTVYTFFKIGWVFALLFDIFTSFMGNSRYIVLKQAFNTTTTEGLFSTIQQMSFQQFLVVAVMTLLVSGSPVAYSYIVADDDIK
jgi:hypothetical protein